MNCKTFALPSVTESQLKGVTPQAETLVVEPDHTRVDTSKVPNSTLGLEGNEIDNTVILYCIESSKCSLSVS